MRARIGSTLTQACGASYLSSVFRALGFEQPRIRTTQESIVPSRALRFQEIESDRKIFSREETLLFVGRVRPQTHLIKHF